MTIYNKLDDESERTDAEITLGLRSILGIFFGLVLICGVFFGFGYSLGHSNGVKPSAAPQVSTQPTAAIPAPITTVVEQPASSSTNDPYNFSASNSAQTKPSGAVLQPAATAAPATATAQPVPAVSSSPSGSAASARLSTTTGDGTAQTTPASYTISNSAKTGTPPAVASSQSPIMVQVAAISRPQDADVLISALQQRGFNATARRNTSDNLLHIQIGPFATRQQAMATRARLISNGYNAILK